MVIQDFHYRVLTDHYNMSLAELNTAREVVISQTTNHYTIMIENSGEYSTRNRQP